MRRVWMAAAIPLMLACSQYRGTGHDISGGTDPSKDRYLTETFLDTPSAGPSLEAGTGCDLDGAGKVVTKDAWLRIRSRWLSGAGRMRFRGGVVREAFYLSSEPVDRVKIYFGDLVPDLGIGLVSSGRRFAYPFSSRHPLYRPAGVKGWTGFYGCFIRGTSVEISSGKVALTVVAGKPMKHGTDGVEYLGTKDVSGLRITAGSGGIRAGLTTLEGGSRKGERITGLELTAVSGGRTCMLEAAALPSGMVSVVWGLAVKENDLYCGMIGWSVPAGTEGYLASFPGLSTASDRSRSGTSLAHSATSIPAEDTSIGMGRAAAERRWREKISRQGREDRGGDEVEKRFGEMRLVFEVTGVRSHRTLPAGQSSRYRSLQRLDAEPLVQDQIDILFCPGDEAHRP